MPQKSRLVQENILYRSYTAENLLWCETQDWNMILQQDVDAPTETHYEKLVVRIYEETEGWESFNPNE